MTLEDIDKIKVHFIIGPGRSGTTLMVRLLNREKQTIAAEEMGHLLYFYKKYHQITYVTDELRKDIQKYIEIYRVAEPVWCSDVGADELFHLLKVGEKITYAQVMKICYLLALGNSKSMDEIRMIFDKDPFIDANISKVRKIFPDAKFLVMIRDYRGYVLSNIQHAEGFSVIQKLFYHAFVWKAHLSFLKDLPDSFLFLRYEDFVSNETATLQKLAKFFELEDWKTIQQPTELEKKREKLKHQFSALDAYTRGKISKVSGKISADRANAWKNFFSKRQLSIMDAVCGDFAEKFAYFPVTPQPSIFKKMGWQLFSLPAFLRVKVFFWLNSPKIRFSLNLKRKYRRFSKI